MRYLYYFLSTIFVIGSFVVLNVHFSLTDNSEFSRTAHADWPDMDIHELVEEADLIAVVETGNLKKSEMEIESEFPIEAQFTELKVKKAIKGNTNKQVTLNQSLNYVEKNQKYLMFLQEGSNNLYYELTDSAILNTNNNKFVSNIKGLEGNYNTNEIEEKVEGIMRDQSNTN